jgi:hypothetical protein
MIMLMELQWRTYLLIISLLLLAACSGQLEYGYGRSSSLAFGTTVVDLGEDISWEDLVQASRTQQRLKKIPLARKELVELIRGPNGPIPYKVIDGQIVEDAEYLAVRNAAAEKFRQTMVEQLSKTPRKEIFIYVHGYHNDFNDAAFAMADLVLMLRDDLDPGPPGRPLEDLGLNFWAVPPGYPASTAKP